MFDTVLVANRGEIALRVMRACRELGLRTVAVYSEIDRDAPHVHYADAAYLLGPSSPGESYLNIERIIEVAHQAGAGAIHPGYGFLSENASFARAVLAAGLVFVGPSPEVMEKVAGKVSARNAAQAADVPVVPGTMTPVERVEDVARLGDEYGYPIAIKAVGGGGGRGLRVVNAPDAIPSAFASARREAENSFKSSELYVEKYLSNPRHIEIQVLADTHGNVLAVGERDCSVQRRHQKLIEESPSPALTPELRAEMCASAARLASSVGYVNAGTLEFLYEQGNFYFLELNSRIQVEHPVTEMVFGIDLVKWQLRIAQGEALNITQDQVQPRGHAIECRINTEDASASFRPTLGTIGDYREPTGFGVRVDSGVRANYTIPQFYDSMLAKLIVWGQDRTEALARMRRALADYHIGNVVTVIPFHQAVMNHPAFIGGDFSVNFIPRHPELFHDLPSAPPVAPAESEAIEMRSFTVEVNGKQFQVRLADHNQPTDDDAPAARRTRKRAGPRKKNTVAVDGVVTPLQGVISEVRATSGVDVQAGQVLFILEAMKMENEITAPHAGTLGEVRVEAGASVEAGSVLATFAKS